MWYRMGFIRLSNRFESCIRYMASNEKHLYNFISDLEASLDKEKLAPFMKFVFPSSRLHNYGWRPWMPSAQPITSRRNLYGT